MTYTQAKMVIWNPGSYSRAKVAKAASFVLGTLGAPSEDIVQASAADDDWLDEQEYNDRVCFPERYPHMM